MKLFNFTVVAIAAALSVNAFATERQVSGNIIKTLTTANTNFGGCMVQLDVSLGSGCPSQWATFSCTGDHAPKDQAYRMYDSALMAYALGRPIKIWVDNALKHNGYCFVTRIDVLPAAP